MLWLAQHYSTTLDHFVVSDFVIFLRFWSRTVVVQSNNINFLWFQLKSYCNNSLRGILFGCSQDDYITTHGMVKYNPLVYKKYIIAYGYKGIWLKPTLWTTKHLPKRVRWLPVLTTKMVKCYFSCIHKMDSCRIYESSFFHFLVFVTRNKCCFVNNYS